MREFTLQRQRWNAFATHGILLEAGEPLCYTLELPWRNNANDVSCIRGNVDRLFRRRYSPHNKCEVFTLCDEATGGFLVDGRGNVNIEVANYVKQLLGCIALGTSVFDMNHDGVDDVEHSRDAFDAFMARLVGVRDIRVQIVNPA